MKKTAVGQLSLLLIFLTHIVSANTVSENESKREITGELKKWHKITFTFDGPETSETDKLNPFMNYRFDVTFIHKESGKTLKVTL